MKASAPLALLLLAFQEQTLAANAFNGAAIASLFKPPQQPSAPKIDRNEKVLELLSLAKQVGQVGSMATEEERSSMKNLAKALEKTSDPKPARYPLEGSSSGNTHNLIYSAAPGGSSGKLGPFVGKVTQVFEDDEIFYNRVQLGPLMISLKAKREIKSDTAIKVTFWQTTISVFGQKLVQKELPGTSGGVWKVKFVGKIKDANGDEKLIRVMETPSLFVLEQAL
jgi:hypothetical protein